MKFSKLLIVWMLLGGMTNLALAQLKVGANPTTIDATKAFEVEADDGNSVAVAKSDGVVTIENRPAAADTDSLLLVNGTSGQVNQMSMSRLSGLLGSSSSGCTTDTDGDGMTDDVDTDDDADGVPDTSDNCPLEYGNVNYGGCPPYGNGSGGIGDAVADSISNANSYQLQSSDWYDDGGTMVIDLSNMAVGQCFDQWITGLYAIKLSSTATTTTNDPKVFANPSISSAGGRNPSSLVVSNPQFNDSYLAGPTSQANTPQATWGTRGNGGSWRDVICVCRVQ